MIALTRTDKCFSTISGSLGRVFMSDRVFHGDMNTPTSLEEKIGEDLEDCGLNPHCPFGVDEMAQVMSKDKKAESGKVHFVLMRSVGEVETVDMTIEEVCRLMA